MTGLTRTAPSARAARLVVLVGTLVALVFAGAPVAQAATSVPELSLRASSSTFLPGEMLWLTGTVTLGGKPFAGKSVMIRRQSVAGGDWRTVGTTTTSAKGTFSYRIRPDASGRYYARVVSSGTSTRSAVAEVTRDQGQRSLPDRADQLGSRLGAPDGAVAMLSAWRRGKLGDPKISKVHYRNYAKGLLVEVTRAGVTRTWLVYGKIRTAYLKAGGPTGTYGVPKADPRCGLLESGCLQRFTAGALYSNQHKRAAYGAKGKTRRTEYIATARSQVGYREPSWRNSKYNAWVDGNNAWCGVFQSWVAAASGNPELVPKRKTYPGLVKAVKEKMLTFRPGSTKHRPKAGTLAFFDYSFSHSGPTHVGLILKVKKNSVVTLEGNTSKSGGFGAKRGVYVRERPKSKVNFYAEPGY